MAGTQPFVHLRMHSEFSIKDSIVKIDDAVERAAKSGMPALALTDLGNMIGMVKFQQKARNAGVKPIIGCDLLIQDEETDETHSILLIAENEDGYRRLSKIVSAAGENKNKDEVPVATVDMLKKFGTGNVIALSGASNGKLGKLLKDDKFAEAEAFAASMNDMFKDSFYVEIQRHGELGEEDYLQKSVELAARLSIPVVATQPIQFMEKGDYFFHEAKICIQDGTKLADRSRVRKYTHEQYFKSGDEMSVLFSDIPEALENAVEIAKRCNYKTVLGHNMMPDYPVPEGKTAADVLVEESYAGLAKRLEKEFPDESERAKNEKKYRDRLQIELDVIVKMGFPGYFLVVSDFIRWAKENDIPVGPGRGSAAGSLVAYALDITNADPIKYNLLFERFLNPERISMPDIDTDFCQPNRGRVIDYVKSKYGEDAVSQIITVGTMGAKAVVRDVARVMDMPYPVVEEIAHLIPDNANAKNMTLQMVMDEDRRVAEAFNKNDERKKFLQYCLKLEGLTRSIGVNASGIVIAPRQTTDIVPVYHSSNGVVAAALDKDDVEKAGLIKFDFLGLANLTIINQAVKFIRKMPGHENFTLDSIPNNSDEALEIYRTGNSIGVFQCESPGMRELLIAMHPDGIEDICAGLALYRPGPLGSGMHHDYVARKNGDAEPEYFHPLLKPVLEPTYGVIVYQEQVMQIAQVLAGYSLGGADLLRRAMGKKKPEEMAKHRDQFCEGAEKNGMPRAEADKLFTMIEHFAEYGFNKSHSLAYSLVSYQTAYIKAKFPEAFFAASLDDAMSDTDKVKILINDAQKNGITILPPDINESNFGFTPVAHKVIRYGLGAVKGVGEAPCKVIETTRNKDGAYEGLLDFVTKVGKGPVNKRVIDALIRAGAFDSINPERGFLSANVEGAIAYRDKVVKHVQKHGGALKELSGPVDISSVPLPEPVQAEPWDAITKLDNEFKAIGFYLTGHPFDAHKKQLGGLKGIDSLSEVELGGDRGYVAGIIVSVREINTARGKMAAVTLDDGKKKLDVTFYSEQYDRYKEILKEKRLLVVEGKPGNSMYNGMVKFTADAAVDSVGAMNMLCERLHLAVNNPIKDDRLFEILKEATPGNVAVRIYHLPENKDDKPYFVDVGKQWNVTITEKLLGELKEHLSEQYVKPHFFERPVLPNLAPPRRTFKPK